LEPVADSPIDAARRGDRGAFNALVESHQRQVYNLCFRTLGNAEDAADATQETFFSAYRAIGGFRAPDDAFRSWLLRIAVNTCYDLLRRRRRRPTQPLDAADATPSASEVLADPEPGPEQQALSAETAAIVSRALADLSADHRLVITLCDLQGLRYDEAASVLGVELGTVKSRLSRARVALRDALAARGELIPPGRRLDER
jgi:RNA polymerase sigma-70 factor (ECF subfamily)